VTFEHPGDTATVSISSARGNATHLNIYENVGDVEQV
jgi:hypothetical protein